MLQKLHSSGLTADKETIRLTLKSLDPVGADKRKRRKLTHCEYHSFGANHTWHIGGYDKLKSFGISIHGAIDGYSRRILWLKLSSSNNRKVIANYYLCCIKEQNLIPHVVRGDHGTENIIVCGISDFCVEIIPTARVKTKVSFTVTQQQSSVQKLGGISYSKV